MKYFIKKAAKFLNVLDYDGNLSITNLSVIIVLTKLAFIQTISLPEVTAFLIAVLGYAHKRQTISKRIKSEQDELSAINKLSETFSKEVDTMKSQITTLQLRFK